MTQTPRREMQAKVNIGRSYLVSVSIFYHSTSNSDKHFVFLFHAFTLSVKSVATMQATEQDSFCLAMNQRE